MKRLDGFYIKPGPKGGFILDMTRQGLRSKTIISDKQAKEMAVELLKGVIAGVHCQIKYPKWRDRPGGAHVISEEPKEEQVKSAPLSRSAAAILTGHTHSRLTSETNMDGCLPLRNLGR